MREQLWIVLQEELIEGLLFLAIGIPAVTCLVWLIERISKWLAPGKQPVVQAREICKPSTICLCVLGLSAGRLISFWILHSTFCLCFLLETMTPSATRRTTPEGRMSRIQSISTNHEDRSHPPKYSEPPSELRLVVGTSGGRKKGAYPECTTRAA